MMVARISAFRRLKEHKEIKFINTVHDSILVDCDKKYLDLVGTTFYSVFKDLGNNLSRMFGVEFNVPLACDTDYGDNWKERTKWMPPNS